MGLLRLENSQLDGKRVFVRADFSTSLGSDGSARQDAGFAALVPTLQFLLHRGASLVIAGHWGEGGGEVRTLSGLALLLAERLGCPVAFVADPFGADGRGKLQKLAPGEAILLENLLCFPGEVKRDKQFVRKLAGLADIYVNEAFGNSTQSLASIVDLPEQMPAYPGASFQKSMDSLQTLVARSKRPFVLIVGGVDLGKKLSFLQKIVPAVDTVLLGGGLVFTFLKARAIPVGASLVDGNLEVDAFQVMQRAEEYETDFVLPRDHVVAESFEEKAKVKTVRQAKIPDNWVALDIGSKTVSEYARVLQKAGSIFWYGPMGMVERTSFSQGTAGIATALRKSNALRVVTGQDNLNFLMRSELMEHVDQVIPGSEAAMLFLRGKILPGIEALKK